MKLSVGLLVGREAVKVIDEAAVALGGLPEQSCIEGFHVREIGFETHEVQASVIAGSIQACDRLNPRKKGPCGFPVPWLAIAEGFSRSVLPEHERVEVNVAALSCEKT